VLEEGGGGFSCGFLESSGALWVVLGGDSSVSDEVAEDGEGLGAEVGVDGLLAGGVDGFDSGGGVFVGFGFGDGLELLEGEVVELADEDWGEGGVEEGFEELGGEGGNRDWGLGIRGRGGRIREDPLRLALLGTSRGGPGEAGCWFGWLGDLWCCLHGTPPLVGMGSLGVDVRVGELYRRERGRLKGGGWRTGILRT
jgi:hypothetical protein